MLIITFTFTRLIVSLHIITITHVDTLARAAIFHEHLTITACGGNFCRALLRKEEK